MTARLRRFNSRELITFMVVGVISLTLAIAVAMRTGAERNRNDTLEYLAHYQCVSAKQDADACAGEIGQSFDMLYYSLVRASTALFGLDGFFCFKLLVGLIVNFFIIYPAVLLSRIPFLTAIIIVSDFRFLEYSANIMRHGLALAVFMTSLLLLVRSRRFQLSKTRFFAAGFHFSALVLALTPAKRVSLWIIFLAVALTGLVSTQLDQITDVLFQLGLGGDKLVYYFHAVSTGSEFVEEVSLATAVPMHYLLVIVVAIAMYRGENSQLFVYLSNLLVVVLCAFMAIHRIPVSYRLLGFMLPIIAILAAHQVDSLSIKFGSKDFARYNLSVLVCMVCVVLFAKNLDVFLIHLE